MNGNLEPPYGAIRKAFQTGRVIPFLGAGASFGTRNPGQVPWQTNAQSYLPTASELAKHLAGEANFPAGETQELTKVAQYYSAVVGRAPLQELLWDIFAFEQPPGAIHRYLAQAAKTAPLLMVTTNYDDLIERALTDAGVPFDTVVHLVTASTGEIRWKPHAGDAQELLSKDLDIDLTKVSVVYKVHGAIERSADKSGQYVITEDDYVDFLSRMTRNTAVPNIFAKPFQQRPFLFLGYGLYDWNLRVVLNRIDRRGPENDIRSWAIETQSKPLEKTLWGKRNVAVFDGITLEDFVTKLRKVPGNRP
jgi:hypothetical protein